MAYQLFYHSDVAKHDLPGIPANIKETIRRAIEQRLIEEPILLGEPLRHSLKGHRKLRVGDYRIIYRISGRNIIILKIGHRKDVYAKIFQRF
ncbi:MAG: type II toxin-antitoxin system RelE/ParE family toxin [Candidatus Omnitrophica bacterium CG12_big_fil_rev_8_21_14_0_65_43_15]|uniref:Type II toxin-antitoxin system RelE/ParE family toxin n=1 Tax=Candidatus Taenaricola geysiri TaxID=1974752 RepID=A0A2J0LEX7_9BACT|nr:MAG: addiction module antitoxin RelB [Candidatus Omnitrophica bacterium CG1_02_43_210]PIV12051.1 MAG: type II toxin-antitoxin system RelE/ParE family toxin [Candidatus Omnitrophica bacterium CG03_land_8_20_14_0_80_43_22]PIW66401.1 MAG: type II toxin-antitoxin system RelE/ParE family toxin [Candidatus Omnitrophica bacterium CG12_big_fil_rev_8_21_14_0_65_43_15]PIY84409.1 MAG: type II toxin-antitoxin system RelE/ParE family toxin [Candidatus Omnitrophica bacterium CG_4_10_14_0_8_um_filter_43_18]